MNRGSGSFQDSCLWLLILPSFRRVQSKLSGHLYLAVRQMTAPSRIDPFLHLPICFDFLRHTLSYSSGKIPFMKPSSEASSALHFLPSPTVFARIETGRIQSSGPGKYDHH